jgi:prepilin-type N-terminal cleavage/methylation domain-containing protein
MSVLWQRPIGFRKDERGFTLPELMTAIAILGILIAIAIIIWLGILERRRVDAAANQLAADMRLAHTSATNQLMDWRIVLYPNKADEDDGADYYLVKLAQPHDGDNPIRSTPTLDSDTPPVARTLPANVRIMDQTYAAGTNSAGSPIVDVAGSTYYLDLNEAVGASGDFRTVEFNSDGTTVGYNSPSGTVRVTIDEDPQRLVRYVSATSRIRIVP